MHRHVFSHAVRQSHRQRDRQTETQTHKDKAYAHTLPFVCVCVSFLCADTLTTYEDARVHSKGGEPSQTPSIVSRNSRVVFPHERFERTWNPCYTPTDSSRDQYQVEFARRHQHMTSTCVLPDAAHRPAQPWQPQLR